MDVDQGRRLIQALNDDLAIDRSARQTGARDEEILWVRDQGQHIVDVVEARTLPPRQERFPMIGRMVTDTWSLTAPLSRDLIEFEQAYQRL